MAAPGRTFGADPRGKGVRAGGPRGLRTRLGGLALGLFLVPGAAAGAGTAGSEAPEAMRVTDVSLRRSARSLALDFRATGKNWHRLEDRIRSGLPLTLTFDIRLYRHRALFVDRRMGAWKVSHTIRYDSLKDLFVLTRSAPGESQGSAAGAPSSEKAFERAIAAESAVRGFRVPLAQHRPPTRYALRIRVSAEPVRGQEVPRYLRILSPVFDPTFGLGPPASDWAVQEFEF